MTTLLSSVGSFRSAITIAMSWASKTGLKSGSLRANDQPSESETIPTPALSSFTEESVAIMLSVCACTRNFLTCYLRMCENKIRFWRKNLIVFYHNILILAISYNYIRNVQIYSFRFFCTKTLLCVKSSQLARSKKFGSLIKTDFFTVKL